MQGGHIATRSQNSEYRPLSRWAVVTPPPTRAGATQGGRDHDAGVAV